MKQCIKRSSAEALRISQMRLSRELTSETQVLREKVNPIFRVFRFLGTIPPTHAIAVFVVLAVLYERMPQQASPAFAPNPVVRNIQRFLKYLAAGARDKARGVTSPSG